MAFIIICIIMLIGFAYFEIKYDVRGLGMIGAFMALMVLSVAVTAKLTEKITFKYDEIRVIETQRLYTQGKERNALMDNNITLKALHINERIALKQMRNGGIFGWYVDDRYEDLKPVE